MADQAVEDQVKKPFDEPADEDESTDAADSQAAQPVKETAETGDQQTAVKAMLSMFADAYDKLFPGADNAAQPSSFKHPGPGGGIWNKTENGWQFTDNSGKVADKFGKAVTDLQMRDGVLVATLADGKIVKSHKDGSSLEYTKDKLTKIYYADGRQRELVWDGDQLQKVTSTKGEWFERQKNAQGQYIDRWKNEKTGALWNGKIDVPNQESGEYILEGADGTNKVSYNRDGSEKTTRRDGSYEIKHPNGAVEGYDRNNEMTSLTGADKVKREFTWATIDGKRQIDSVKVTGDGKVNTWSLKDGKWLYNGSPTNYTFSVDSKTGTYSYYDSDKDRTTTVTANSKEMRYGDGTQVVLDDKGEVKSATKGNTSFEYVRDKNNVSEIKETNNGELVRTWKKNSDGKWTDGNRAIDGPLSVTETGEPSFANRNTTTILKLDGRTVEQTKNADNSLMERSEGRVKVTAADGSTRELYSKKDDKGADVYYREETVRNGKREVWERQTKPTANGGTEYTDEWKNSSTGEVEIRKQMTLSDSGELNVQYGDGSTYVARTNGTERRENKAEKWSMELENGKASTVNFGDGTVRTYKWKGDVVDSMVVTPPGGKPVTWTRIGEKKYKTDTGAVTNGTIDINSKGKYLFDDFDDKALTTRLPDGRLFKLERETGVETEYVGGKPTAMRKGDSEFKLQRDDKGNVNEISDTRTNTRWSKQEDGSWKAEQLDDKKAWTKPDDNKRQGDVVVNEKKGTITFLGADGSLLRHSFNGIEKVSRGTELEKKIVEDQRLTDSEKIRFLDNLDVFSKRKLSDEEKAKTLKDIERTLAAKDDPEQYFDATERAKLAEQMAWHVANPSLDAQGQKPNCNVTDIRLAMEHGTPSLWTNTMADMITKGYFKTADGTVIRPKDPQSFRPSEAEKTFPPSDGDRSWLGRVSDVTMLDIHWQRRTKDALGNRVAKGSMTYEEIKPTDADDTGGRIFYYYKNGDQWYRAEQKRVPDVYGNDIMDIYKQISGEKEDNRFIINSSKGIKGDGVTQVSSVQELDAALSKGPYPKIIEVQNDVLYKKKHDGKDHCHVVVVLGYENGKALIDNSHHSSQDRLKEGIPVEHLFEATKLRGQAKYEAEEDKQARLRQSEGRTTVVSNNNQIRYQNVPDQQRSGFWQNGVYYTYADNNSNNRTDSTTNNVNGGGSTNQVIYDQNGYWQNGVYYRYANSNNNGNRYTASRGRRW